MSITREMQFLEDKLNSDLSPCNSINNQLLEMNVTFCKGLKKTVVNIHNQIKICDRQLDENQTLYTNYKLNLLKL